MALLSLSAADLAKASGVGPATIRRYEMQVSIPAAKTSKILSIKFALERAGIEFTGDPLVDPASRCTCLNK